MSTQAEQAAQREDFSAFGDPLLVEAPGVLENDTYNGAPASDAGATVALINAPAFGTLECDSDPVPFDLCPDGGIGTGVLSAGMIAFGSGVIAMLFATRFGILAPVVALVLAAVIRFILGYISNNILNMKIPAMVQALTEMAVVGALSLMGFAALITGGFTFAGLTEGTVTMLGMTVSSNQISFIGGGLIAVAFLLGAIAIQHPFNATLGPGWKQDRMLMLTAECGFLSMIVAAFMSFALISAGSAMISLLVAILGWAYTYNQYICLSKRDAAAWLDAKPIPEMEGH